MSRILQLMPARLRIRVFRARQAARDVSSVVRGDRHEGPLIPIIRSPVPKNDAIERTSDRAKSQITPKSPIASEPQRITFRSLDRTITANPNETILQAALRQDVDLVYSCTLGGCAACMLRLVDGEVTYDDPESLCLTPDDDEEGYILACVAKPNGPVVLEDP